MESFWLETAKQVPALAVLAGVVWKFLSHISDSNKSNAAMASDITRRLEGVSKEGLETATITATSVEKLAELSRSIERCQKRSS